MSANVNVIEITYEEFQKITLRENKPLTEVELKLDASGMPVQIEQEEDNNELTVVDGKIIYIPRDDSDFEIYMLVKKFGYFDILYITDVKEEDLSKLETLAEDLAKFGIFFKQGFDYNRKVINKYKMNIFESIDSVEDFIYKVKEFNIKRNLPERQQPNAVYVENIQNYEEYLKVKAIIEEVSPQIRLVYVNQESANKYFEKQYKQEMIDMVQNRDCYEITKQSLAELYDNADVQDYYNKQKILSERLENSGKTTFFVRGDYSVEAPYKLMAMLYYKKGYNFIFEEYYPRGRFQATLADLNSKRFMLMEDRILDTRRTGLRVFMTNEQVLLANVTGIEYQEGSRKTTFQGLPLEEFLKIDTDKSLEDLELNIIEIMYSVLAPVEDYGSIVQLFNLEDDTQYEEGVKSIEKLIKVLEVKTKIKRPLTVRDLIIQKIKGVVYIGWLDLRFQIKAQFILDVAGNGQVYQDQTIKSDKIGSLHDMDILIDFEENKEEIMNKIYEVMMYNFAGNNEARRKQLEPQLQKILTVLNETPTVTRNKNDLDGIECFLTGVTTGRVVLDDNGVSKFRQHLYNPMGYILQNRFLKQLSNYLSIRNIRNKEGAEKILDIYGNLRFNHAGKVTINETMFVLSDEILTD